MPEVVLLVAGWRWFRRAGAQEVERFALADPEGKLRRAGTLDGGPAMWLYDARKPRAKLALARSGEPH